MGTFRTKLDFSNNRQVKQTIETTTVLSGGTSFGVTYSQLPSGPNYTLSAITLTIPPSSATTGTFSGNNTTTVFTWPINDLYLADNTFSAITPSNSASSQTSSFVFTADTSTMFTVDGNVGYGSYTGVGFTMFATSFVGLGGGSYSGTVNFTDVNYVQAPGLDFSGRTIWNDTSGITRTERLIITNNPQVGYVWTCINSEGMGRWQPSSGSSSASTSTIWTAGTGANSAVLGGSGGIASGSTSVSEGNNTIAGGDYSHAEGRSTTASGDASHAEGETTKAIGFASHAEGEQTIASGDNSHAEGKDTIASGQSSHAEGMNTIASGDYSHAEGLGDSTGFPTASGLASHAEGKATLASGDYSHAEGNKTIASGDSSHAGGDYSEVLSDYGFIHSYYSKIFPNSNNSAILGGYLNNIDKSEKSGIFVGDFNTISGGTSGNTYNMILGGSYNEINNHANSFIIGGSGNTIHFDLEDIKVNFNFEAILNSRNSSISASTNAEISNSVDVSIGDNISSSIRNSFSVINNTEITGTYIEGFASGLNVIDNSYDAKISGWTFSNTIMGSSNTRIYGLETGSSATRNTVLGSVNVLLDNSDGYTNIDTGVINSEGVIMRRNMTNLVGASKSITSLTGGYLTVLATRTANLENANYSTILGGRDHELINVDYSTIVGGSGHTISESIYSGILGGANNNILFNSGYGWGSIIGGDNNTVSGASNYFAIIGGGNSTISDSNGAIIVSEASSISGSLDYSAILAGSNNTMTTTVYTGPANTIMAGGNLNLYRNNNAIGLNNSVMLGGQEMIINGASNMNNMTTSYQSSMSGTVSLNSIISSDNCVINTGTESGLLFSEQSNLRNVYQSFMLGGFQSTISGTSTVTSAFILGGEKHVISGGSGNADYSAIINGSTNRVSQSRNAIIIGGSNVGISGGSNQSVAILAKDSWIENASENSGLFSTEISYINNSNLSTIMGGSTHRIVNNGFSAVLGGSINIISASTLTIGYNTIVGGVSNRMYGSQHSTMLGGYSNRLYDQNYSGTFAGYENQISGGTYGYNTVLGGYINSISGSSFSSIIGGRDNKIINIERSVVIGGSGITATISDTVYVPDLVIDGLTSTDPIATNSSGKIVAGTSDARLKQNINGLSNSLDIVKNLRGVSFEYTPESEMGGGIRYGFIAQEVQQHVPDIVRNRAKGDGMLSLNYNEIVPILVEAVKELSSGITTSNNTHLETQTILAEDNNVELNFNGTQQTAIGGGLSVLHAKGQDQAADLITDTDGNFVTNNDFKPQALTIPFYTPNSSNDVAGNEGNITRDDNYLYVKTSSGWKRTNLESF